MVLLSVCQLKVELVGVLNSFILSKLGDEDWTVRVVRVIVVLGQAFFEETKTTRRGLR